jgi:glyoxylase-like metal-dependent hydrolase (beta-lactamase superfamily II)
MKRVVLITITALAWGWIAVPANSAAAGFQKVSAHVFYLESKAQSANTGAVITPEGILLVDPPPEAEIPGLLAALKAITARPVRWIVHTDYQQANNAGIGGFMKLGATVLCSKELDRLAAAAPPSDPTQPAAPRPNPRFLFSRQMNLYPATLEVRILALKSKARTAGDVVVFLPAEKVLLVGGLMTPSGFPLIDSTPGEGNASGWVDGLKEIVDFVPLLKSAMPQPKQEQPPAKAVEPEKSPEEMVVVITSEGAPIRLQNMKDLLAAAQKMRAQATKAIAAGRSREDFVKSLPADVFGAYANVESFAAQLFDDLSRK